MSLFRRNYQAERQFMRHNYIRLRGRTWFLTLYGIFSTLFVCTFIIYCTILLDFLIRVTGSYLSTFGNYLRSNIWQSPNQEDFLNMAKAVFMPANMFSIFGRLTIVTTIFMLIMFLLFEKLWALGKVYDWYQTFRDLTRNTNRFATVREVDATYKLVPDRNKFYSGAPGQPVLHTSGYTLEFFMFHPFLWAIQWVKRPLGMNSLEFSGIYKRLRPTLISRFPNLYKNQLTVKGGFEGFYWVDTSNTHSKTTGMTRSSKDQMRGYPLIDIIRRAEVKWNIVDTDAKNEDAKMSFQALREAGYDFRLLNIMEPSESESWNPLELAIDYAFDGDWDNVNAAITMFDKVFSLDWTLPNQAAFDDRAKAMMPYVTNDVVKNSLDFKPDPDKMMDQSGVKITYDHMDFIPISANVNEVKAKVVVFLKSQIDDRPEATTRQVYDVSYSPKQDKVTQLDRLGNFRLQSDSSLLSE